jgi:hypothetical protein
MPDVGQGTVRGLPARVPGGYFRPQLVPPPLPPWAFVQAKQGHTATLSTLAVQFNAAVTLGNRIIVLVSCGHNTATTFSSISDSAGNAYNADRNFTGSDNSYVRSAPVTLGDQTQITVTVNISGGDDFSVWIAEYAGLSTAANAVDVSGTFDGTVASTSHAISSAGAVTAGNECAIVFNNDDGAGGSQVGAAGLTLRGTDTASAFTSSFGDKNIDTVVTASGTVTTGNSVAYTAVIVVYKLAGQVAAAVLPAPQPPGFRQRYAPLVVARRPRTTALVASAELPPIARRARTKPPLMARARAPMAPPWGQAAANTNQPPFVQSRSQRRLVLGPTRRARLSMMPALDIPPQSWRQRLRMLWSRRTRSAMTPTGLGAPQAPVRPRVRFAWVVRSRPVALPLTTIAIVVLPPLDNLKRRALRLWRQARGKMQEPPWAQAAANTNQPPFLDGTKRRVFRWLLKPARERSQEPPWGTLAAPVNPPWVPAQSRLRRAWLTLRTRRVQIPFEIPSFLQGDPKDRYLLRPRRASFAQPPWPPVVVLAPLFADWVKRRVQRFWLKPKSGRHLAPPWLQAAQTVPLQPIALTIVTRSMAAVIRTRSMAITALTRSLAVVARTRDMATVIRTPSVAITVLTRSMGVVARTRDMATVIRTRGLAATVLTRSMGVVARTRDMATRIITRSGSTRGGTRG